MYASDYYLKKWKDDAPMPKQQMDAIILYSNFYQAFFEKACGISWNEFGSQHLLWVSESAQELIRENDILIKDSGKGYVYFIPKEKEELIQWVLDNVKTPYKILKRNNLFFLRPKSTHYRDEARKYTIEFRKKYDI